MTQNFPLDFDGLHLESLRGHSAPLFADYPQSLPTRRTLAQSAGAIGREREHAPTSLRTASRGRGPRPV